MSKNNAQDIPVLTVVLRSLGAFLVVAAVFLLIVVAMYSQDVRHQRSMLEQEAEHVVSLQREMLLFELRSVESDLLYLSSQDNLKRFLSGDASARGRLEREYASFALNKSAYDQIRCLDTGGQEIIRVNYGDGDAQVVPMHELQSKATRYYYRTALSLDRREVFVSPFDLNMEYGEIEQPIKPVIRFLTPVFDDAGRKQGILILNYLGAPLLQKLKQASIGFRGETMLLNPKGEYLQAPDADDEWGWLLHHRHNFPTSFPGAWELGKRTAFGRYRVGRDLFTFRSVSPGRRLAGDGSPAAPDHRASSLVLVAYVSAATAQEPSRVLLSRLLLMYAGAMTVVGVLSYFWARFGILRRYHERQIADSEARLRQLSTMLLEAQEAERRSLSRDLHDQLGQQVTAIRLDLRSLAKTGSDVAANPLLERAIAETDQLLQSLHEVAAKVRPSVLDDLGLPDAVDSFLSEYEQRKGIAVDFTPHFDRQEIPSRVGENAYRILQEALANVALHAGVDRVEVAIETDDEALQITVRDRGVGFDGRQQKPSTRLGILGMRERVELLNGQFHLESEPGRGTRIRVSIPLPGCQQSAG